MGVLDTVKQAANSDLFDISFVHSIQHFRQALALNDDRCYMVPQYVDTEDTPTVSQPPRSCVQAWFLGTHGDMGGAQDQDGLSLYPLQWMLRESRKVGLVLESSPTPSTSVGIHNPLILAFPTTLALSSIQDRPNEDVWRIEYRGGLEVEMHCLDSTLRKEGFETRINYSGSILTRKPRAPFAEDDALIGCKAEGKTFLFVSAGG